MLGSWAAVAAGDFAGVAPQPLIRFSVDLASGAVTARRACADLDHFDYVKAHPDEQGAPRCPMSHPLELRSNYSLIIESLSLIIEALAQ